MKSSTAYVIFTAGILWYIIKYNFHLQNFSFFFHISKLSQLNVILFWIVTITTYLTAAVISLKNVPNTEGITVALLLVVVYGVLFDTSYSHFPGKGLSAIITAILFFIFDTERKDNLQLYHTILCFGALYTGIFVFMCIATLKQPYSGINSRKTKKETYTLNNNFINAL